MIRVFIMILGFILAVVPGSSHLLAQDKRKVDSLQKYLKTAKEDTIYARTLNLLADQLGSSDPDTAMHYARRALELSEKLDFGTGKGNAYTYIAHSYRTKGEYQ